MRIAHNKAARERLISGVRKLSKTVKSTLGPKGGTVILQTNFGSPTVTKDGVTIAKHIVLNDSVENQAVQIVKQAAVNTVNKVGDGTTTTTVLAEAIINEGLRFIEEGVRPIVIKRELDAALPVILERLDHYTAPADLHLKSIATISTNNDEVLGGMISDVFNKVGKEGLVKVMPSERNKIDIEYTTGSEYENGYINPVFMTNEVSRKAEYKDISVLVLSGKLTKDSLLESIFTYTGIEHKPLYVIVNEIDNEAYSLLIYNRQKLGLPLVVTVAPSFGDTRKDLMKDIAVLTGTQVYEAKSIYKIESNGLGHADAIIVTDESQTIIGGRGLNTDEFNAHVELINAREAESAEKVDKDFLKKRVSWLLGKVAIINVGATTDAERNELKDRIDDAVAAVTAAMEGGILPGGGSTLYHLSRFEFNNYDFEAIPKIGMVARRILSQALKAPMHTLLANANFDISTLPKYLDTNTFNKGVNVLTNEMCYDLTKEGIVDPAQVTKIALESAISVANIILTTEAVITNEDED